MKKLLFVLVMLLMTTMATAQKISYQAVVRDSHNRLVVNTDVTVVVTITHGAGTYTESLNGTTNANGLMSLEIGGASGFDAIDWRHAQIKTLVLLPGGETVEDQVLVTAVPIALYANYAADVSPSAPAITAIYSDMAALGTRIADDSLVLANRITALNAHLNDTLGNYYNTTQVKTAIHDTADAIRAAIPASQVNADWNATSGPAEILNKPTIPTTVAELTDAANYTTNAHLNDTLSHYYNDVKVNDTLSNYYNATQVKTAIHDTANAIRAAIPASQVNADWSATSGIAEILNKPTIPTTVAELTDAANYTTNAHLNDTLNKYYDTTQVKTAIHDTANAIRAAIPVQVNADWEATSGAAEILNKPTIPTTVAELTDAANYTTNAHLNDTLSHYYDTTRMKKAIHDTANVLRGEFPVVNDARITIALIRGTESGVTNPTFGVNQDTNQTVTINIPEAATVNNGQLTIIAAGDTTRFTANQSANDTVRLNKFATKDTLKNFVNKLALRDSVNNIVKDSLAAPNSAINLAIDTIARHNISDSTRMMFDTLHKYYATNAHLNDTLKYYTTSKQIDTLLGAYATKVALRDSTKMVFDTLHKYYATKDTLKNFVNKLALRDSVNNIVKDSLAAPNSAINMAIDTIARHNISDSTRMVFDTLHKYYATKDTLKNFVNKLAIRDSVNNIVKDSLAAPNSAINHAIDTIARHNISDSTRMVFDTLHKYYATKDTLKNFVNKLAIRDSVNNIMKDSLAAPNSAINMAIDTIARHNISDSTRMVFDTLHKYYATNAHLNDTLKHYTTSKQIDTLLGAYATKVALRDSTKMMRDTLHKYYATKDTLKNFVNKLAIRDSVNNIVKDSLAAPNSAINLAIDTIARHNISDSTRMVFDTLHYYYTTNAHLNDTLKYYTTSKQIDTLLGAYATKVALRDSIQKVNNRLTYDSTKLAERIHDDSLLLAQRIHKDSVAVMDTLHKYYATKDTLKNFVRNDALCAEVMACTDIKHMRDSIQKVNTRLTMDSAKLQANIDTVSSHIRAIIPTVSNETVTINVNTTPAGSFTLNQSSNAEINLNNIAIDTADNNFTGTNTVPSGFNIKTTNNSNCNDVVVNACDLWAVFDSLTRRINALQEEVNALKNATSPVFNELTLSEFETASMKATASFSSPGFNITSYNFCYDTLDNMSTATCVTTNVPTLVLTGLKSYKQYYVSVSATNSIGTTTSDTVSAMTLAHAPTATMSLSTKSPNGFAVNLSDIDYQEVGNGTLIICYKPYQDPDCSVGTDSVCLAEVNIQSGTTTYNQNILNEQENTKYCVSVSLSNGEYTTVITDTVRSGGTISLTITGPASVNRCGATSVEEIYSTTLVGDNESDYTFDWSVGSSTTTKDTVVFTSTSPSSITVTCTATNIPDTSIKVVGSITTTVTNNTNNKPAFTTCEDELYSQIKSVSSTVSLNWGDGHTITGSDVVVGAANTYTPGVYTITAEGSTGCKVTKQVRFGLSQPCTVDSWKSNEKGPSETSIDSLKDVENHWYAVVQIGSQCWMKSNLRTTRYSDSTSIENGTGSTNAQETGKICYYKPTENSNNYSNYSYSLYDEVEDGLYYTWYAVMRGNSGSTNNAPSMYQGICPEGWHVPSIAEWNNLISYVKSQYNNSNNYVTKLAAGCDWKKSSDSGRPGYFNDADRNIFGLSGRPSGYAESNFKENSNTSSNQSAYFWSCTQQGNTTAKCKYFKANDYYIREYADRSKYYGYSVRCVRNPQPIVNIELSVDYPSPTLCNGNPVTVTYTVVSVTKDNVPVVTGNEYTWSVSGGDAISSGNTCTVTYSTASTYQVSCTVTNTTENINKNVTRSTEVASNGTAPRVTFCDEDSTIMLKTVISGGSSPVYLTWGDGQSVNSGIDVGLTHKYAAPGVYTISVTGNTGCVKIQTVTITGSTTLYPCTAPSTHAAQTATTGGGYQGAPDGKETVNGEGKITSVTDYDGNVYSVVQIGTGANAQCWMAENLRCTHSPRTGTYIVNPRNGVNKAAYSYESKAAHWYSNDSLTYAPKGYGLLYNWCAALDTFYASANKPEIATASGEGSAFNCTFEGNRRGICPKGWHVPTTTEWNDMVSEVSGTPVTNNDYHQGNQATRLVKGCEWNESTNNNYNSPCTYSNSNRNASGFGVLPAGGADTKSNENFSQAHYDTYFWCCEQFQNDKGYRRHIQWSDPYVFNETSFKCNSLSVRCVRD